MKRQKSIQKEWYEHNPPVKGGKVAEIGAIIHIQRLKGLIPVEKAELSLNCGCGSGGQKDIYGTSVGTDISFENIRSFVKAGGQGVVADMEFLPFRDQTFDMVYGFGILHHLSDIKKGVSEAARVLKRGGYMGFGGENNGWCPFTYIMAFIYRNWKVEKGFYRIREGNLRRIFNKSGINGFKISKRGMTIYGMGQALYRLTSVVEGLFSHFKLLNYFSGYCYIAGKKV
jgi:SAM-dependent methyltransferase